MDTTWDAHNLYATQTQNLHAVRIRKKFVRKGPENLPHNHTLIASILNSRCPHKAAKNECHSQTFQDTLSSWRILLNAFVYRCEVFQKKFVLKRDCLKCRFD